MTIEERLNNGEVLYLPDQWALFISSQRGKIITWGIQHTILQRILSEGGTPDYEVEEHNSLAEALLKVAEPDHEWIKRVPGH